MTILKTAYDTTACAGSPVVAIIKSLEHCANDDGLRSLDAYLDMRNQDAPLRIYMVLPDHASMHVPPFVNPIVVDKRSVNEWHTVRTYIDVRAMVARHAGSGSMSVRSYDDLRFRIFHGLMVSLWNQDVSSQTRVNAASPLPIRVFSTLFSDEISNIYTLTPGQTLRVRIIAALFYYMQFQQSGWNHVDKDRMVLEVTRAIKVEPDPVERIIELIENLTTIDDFCLAVRQASDAQDRLASFDRTVVYGRLLTVWFGANYSDILSAAYEYPPNWISVLWAASYETGQRRCRLSKIIQSIDRDGLVKSFQGAMADMFGGHQNLERILDQDRIFSN